MTARPGTPPGADEAWIDKFGRGLKTVGVWAYTTPILLLGLASFVLAPASISVGVMKFVIATGVLALQITVVTVFMLLTAAALWWAFLRGGRVARLPVLGRFEPLVRGSVAASMAVAGFAGVTSLLYLQDALEIRGKPIQEELVIDKAAEHYVWHVANAVPLLDIPANLRWEKPIEFDDRLGGFLLVVFIGVVILPLIQVIPLIAAAPHPYEQAVVQALRSALPGWKVHPTRGKWGYDRAVVENRVRVLIDVMRDVWTEDAALRRLNEFKFFVIAYDVIAYILVVDVVGDRARDKIEAAFAKNEFPARLAVWRSDQPPAYLAQVVRQLEEEIEPLGPAPSAR